GHTLGLMHNYAASVNDNSSVMDYPHPAATLASNGKIELTNAYDNKIGEWDKISITWGYQDFPKNINETEALNAHLKTAGSMGYQFISDVDARAPGGLHPQAHLWDNGKNAVEELNRVMNIREKALQNFGLANIQTGTPMSFLEDVLVPIYLFHRYQLEAATKIIGGMHYNYALKGDGQVVTKPVAKTEELKALNALLNAIDPEKLMLPQRIIDQIPPRPAGYDFNRELFTKRTGLSFDALSPAETLTDFIFSFLFQTDRLNRIAQHGQTNNNLGLNEMVSSIINKTWKAPRQAGMQGLLQMQNEQILLTYLLSASINDNTSYAAKAVLQKNLADLKALLEKAQKGTNNEMYAGHLLLAIDSLKAPEKAKPTIHKAMPPGAPIGCFDESLN
ncbi:MAG TPA: zinc-dependent metalloprotease, partial [Chitinophagaceae bacterium]|nr:zinc-dependent metalloprotease [Chitinophagaceae bacterium]